MLNCALIVIGLSINIPVWGQLCFPAPPEQYLAAGQQYATNHGITPKFLSPRRLARVCTRLGAVVETDDRFYGCIAGERIFIANDLTEPLRQWAIDHELGHLGGWPADHSFGPRIPSTEPR